MLSYLENFAKTHLFYLILIAVGVVAFNSWLKEHDQRLQAVQIEKVKEQENADLRSQNKTLTDQKNQADELAKNQISKLRSDLAKIKTPAQAIAAIPDLSNLPLNSRPAIDDPNQVSVGAVALAQELTQCRVDAASLAACQVARAKDEQIIVNQDKEISNDHEIIAAYKKPRGFWKRLGSHLKSDGEIAAISVVVGIILAGGHL